MRKFSTALLLTLILTISLAAQSPAPADLQKKVEAYVRNLYAWGPDFKVAVGPLTDSPIPAFYRVQIDVSLGDQSDSLFAFVSKDGRHFFQGDILDLSRSPFDDNRSKISLDSAPSKGPANAAVVVVEFSDFQCPTCRRYHQSLRTLVPKFPQVRFVFKNFPLTHIHPWADLAATAGVCAARHSPAAFWKVHDSIFDNQDRIRPDDAYDRFSQFATEAGLDTRTFQLCLASADAKAAVQADLAEGQALRVANTPTIFVNGRRVVGGDPANVEQFILFELSKSPSPSTSSPASTPAPPSPAPTPPRP